MNDGRPFSPVLQQVLNRHLRLEERSAGDRPRLPALCENVAALSQLFTKKRALAVEHYLIQDHLRDAYLSYFFPVNFAKMQMLLDELPPDVASEDSGRPLRVLDVGSGPGTAALAVLDWVRQGNVGQGPIDAVLVDQALPALLEAEQLWDAYKQAVGDSRSRLRPIRANLERAGALAGIEKEDRGTFDIIVIANALNELWRGRRDVVDRRAAFIKALLERLALHGSLILMEPALRETSRDLHRVRDRLMAEATCTVYSPCLHEKPCPALIKDDDWCHEERPWTPPPLVSSIDQVVGFIKDALKFSYVILRKDGRTIVPRQPDVFRIVSELREMKGEKRAWLCNETGRPEVGRQDRLRSESNAAVDDWHRGAIVRISEIVRKERKGREATVGRIPASATVEIIRPV